MDTGVNGAKRRGIQIDVKLHSLFIFTYLLYRYYTWTQASIPQQVEASIQM
jgi:hypothetical protein